MTTVIWLAVIALCYLAGVCSAMGNVASGVPVRHRTVDYQRAWICLLVIAAALAFWAS